MNMEPVYKNYCRIDCDAQGVPENIQLHCPDNFNFAYDVLDVLAAREPERRALVWCNDRAEERSFSFEELSRLSGQAANYLASWGIGKGDRVFLILKRHYSYWYILPALHRLGAVAIPATYMLTVEDIAHRLQFADVKAVICVGDEEPCAHIRQALAQEKRLLPCFCVGQDQPGFTRLDLEMEAFPADRQRPEQTSRDPMLLYFTSGTTGTPKALLHSYAYPLCHIPTALCWQGVLDGGLHLSVADTGWAKASWGKIYGQWLCGSAVMVYDCKNLFVPDLLHVLEKYQVTTFCAPPTVYRYLVKFGFSTQAFRSVVRVTTAGESLNPSISQAFTQQTGLPIYEGYGQTETVMISGCMGQGPYPAGSIGRTNPLYTVELERQEGEDYGEIVLVPKNAAITGICSGYLLPDGTVQDPMDDRGRYHTNDLARMDEAGNLYFLSRKDDMIKSCGYRVSPYEVEDVLIQHPAISDCVICGVPDAQRGNIVKAKVLLHPGFRPSQALEREIRQFSSAHIAQYKCPRIIEFCDRLPKTISGKNRRSS